MLGNLIFERLTLMTSSDNLSPTDEIGGADSQSPECGDDAAASSVALPTFNDTLEKTLVTKFLTIRPYQTI